MKSAESDCRQSFAVINRHCVVPENIHTSPTEGTLALDYVCDDLADDEADANKIKKAEKRAAAKFKSSQVKKRKSSAEFSTSAA